MGKIILYGLDPSPPTRACMMTMKALNLPFEYVIVNLLNGEHLSEEYLAKNPQHTVPCLEDDGNILWESHAIMAYLVSKYGKNDSLYPQDFLQRALIDQRLHFESGVVFQGVLRPIIRSLLFEKNSKIPLSRIDASIEVYDFMEVFLKDTDYVAGDTLTIADFSLMSSITTMIGWLDVDADKYPKVTAWMKRIAELPYYQETNGNGAEQVVGLIKASNPIVVP